MSDKAKASGKRSRRTRILAGLGIFFLLLAAAIGALKNHFAASLYDQREGERWGLGGGAAQISCFYGSGQTLKEEEIPELNYQLEEILKADPYPRRPWGSRKLPGSLPWATAAWDRWRSQAVTGPLQ
ncbi:MAG: hypothetical protein II628_11950 [Lachnospiraceae bacterium]|nr:hypothetical protein [Lachnospiraceae bacterium]